MTREEIQKLTRAQQFQPFRLVTTDKKVYEVKHPDQALVVGTSVVLPSLSDPDWIDFQALIHIIRAETPAPPTPNGASAKS